MTTRGHISVVRWAKQFNLIAHTANDSYEFAVAPVDSMVFFFFLFRTICCAAFTERDNNNCGGNHIVERNVTRYFFQRIWAIFVYWSVKMTKNMENTSWTRLTYFRRCVWPPNQSRFVFLVCSSIALPCVVSLLAAVDSADICRNFRFDFFFFVFFFKHTLQSSQSQTGTNAWGCSNSTQKRASKIEATNQSDCVFTSVDTQHSFSSNRFSWTVFFCFVI